MSRIQTQVIYPPRYTSLIFISTSPSVLALLGPR
jgi:hypothetical protein